MNPHVHISNLLEIINEMKSSRKLVYQAGSPVDRSIKGAQLAVIEYNKTKVVSDGEESISGRIGATAQESGTV